MDRIRVGAFELYPSERRLCASGRPVELGARAFDLLLVLVEHAGQLVPKATLIERVWPRVIVDENNLPAQIARLRRVLGAGAIRTVPRFGYRLDLDVSTSDAPPPGPAQPEAPPRARARAGRLGPLVGRDEDLRAVRAALGSACLVTVVGGAGVGKTRLAQELLAHQPEQPGSTAAWISLEPLDDVQLVPSAIALSLGLSLPEGSDRYAALGQAIADMPVLLVLDGAEHLGDALAARLAALLSQAPGIRALVTSQAPLGVAGENIYRLSALPAPAAVALFTLRATEADWRFDAGAANLTLIAEICRRLDGNPLALELAAARVPAFGLAALIECLDDRFRLLKQAARSDDPRHCALQAAFDWSYGLLSAAEQRVFNRLGAFAGSSSLDAAVRCVADETIDRSEAIDLIGRLVDRSLVKVLPVDPPRYRLLETARCYALGRLAAGNALEPARRQMAATMLELLDRAYDEYWSLDEAEWLNRYEAELDNVRAALEWASSSDRTLAVSLYGSAWPLFIETDLDAEGRAGHDEALRLLSDGLPRARVGRFWEAVATYDSGRQVDRARYAAELSASMHEAARDGRARYYALMQLALNWRDDPPAARAAFDAALRIENPAWPARLLAHGAMVEGALLMAGGQHVEAREAYRRALGLALTTSERQALEATVHVVELDIACGATAGALQLARPLALSLRHSGRRETRFELLVLAFSALLLAGEMDEARAVGAELYELAVRFDPDVLYASLDAMTLLACRDGRHAEAARIARCADSAHESHGRSRRGPAGEQVRVAAATILGEQLGPAWRASTMDGRDRLDEAAACRLALGRAWPG